MTSRLVLVLALLCAIAAPAQAQRLPFERSFAATGVSVLDVSTNRGKIDISAGGSGQIVVSGTVTVRTGWDVPVDALDIARRIAANPPAVLDGATLRLRPPAGDIERRAVTISYQVRVPAAMRVQSVSDSGATTIAAITGPVDVRTGSGAIDLARLGGTTGVTTGSGAVTADRVDGELSVTTSSSAFKGSALGGGLTVRTQSGSVTASLTGTGDVDVRTGSSAIDLRGLAGGLLARSDSGRLSIHGAPGKPWQASTGSSAVEIVLGPNVACTLDARTDSGSVRVDRRVEGAISKRRVSGTVGGGGPLVRVESRSGSVDITSR